MIQLGVSSHPFRRLSLVALVWALLASGCSHEGTPVAPPTESDVLAAITGTAVLPSLAEVAGTARALADSTRKLCEQRDDMSLEQARDAWRDAYLAWRRAAPFLFGPADALALERRIGSWPVHSMVLDNVVAAEDRGRMADGVNVRGYAAAEYLLFVPADAAAATAAGRCAHSREVTDEIADLTARAQQEWDHGFAEQFVSAGDGKPFLIPGDALSLAVAEALNVTERMLWERLGVPSGFFKEKAKPELLEAWYSESSRDGLLATLEGLHLALIGDGRTSLAELVATKDGLVSTRDPALAADINRQIEKALTDLGDSDVALRTELRDKPSRLKRLYRGIQKLQDQLVEVSLVLELDVRSPVESRQRR